MVVTGPEGGPCEPVGPPTPLVSVESWLLGTTGRQGGGGLPCQTPAGRRGIRTLWGVGGWSSQRPPEHTGLCWLSWEPLLLLPPLPGAHLHFSSGGLPWLARPGWEHCRSAPVSAPLDGAFPAGHFPSTRPSTRYPADRHSANLSACVCIRPGSGKERCQVTAAPAAWSLVCRDLL